MYSKIWTEEETLKAMKIQTLTLLKSLNAYSQNSLKYDFTKVLNIVISFLRLSDEILRKFLRMFCE
jgi:hypothetical protein